MDEHRYDDFAVRMMVEYAVPLWRRRGVFYGADAFVSVGGFLWPAKTTFASEMPVLARHWPWIDRGRGGANRHAYRRLSFFDRERSRAGAALRGANACRVVRWLPAATATMCVLFLLTVPVRSGRANPAGRHSRANNGGSPGG